MGQIALLAGFTLVFWLMRQDMKARTAGSRAILIPGLWVFIQTTHPLSYWMDRSDGGETLFDTLVALGLMVSAVVVVQRRGLKWNKVATRNAALFLIYGYFLLSAVWSDEPALSVKRIIKDFGLVPMALVLLTEIDPCEAIRAVFARLSYIVFTFSVITIKWFPEIGRQARHSGDSMFRGITLHKNSLGLAVCICSLMLLWDMIEIQKMEGKPKKRKQRMAVCIGMLVMGLWLLATCESKTSVLCLILGSAMIWIGGRVVKMRAGKRVLVGGLAAAILLTTVDKTFGISDLIIQALGKDPSLTGRTEIWEQVRAQNTDPWIGDGFYVFWDSEKGKRVVEALAQIKSTHNGYLEVYVDGGLIGVGLLCLFLLVAGKRVIDGLFVGNPLGRLGLTFWIIAIIYNFSESSYFRLDPLWFVLLLTTLEVARQTRRRAADADLSPELRWRNAT